jgi:phosphatidylglycerophosphatase A
MNSNDRWKGILDTGALHVARLGPVGLLPKMPGTGGSAVAACLAPFLFTPLPLPSRILLLAALFILGGVAAGRTETLLGKKDPRSIVIDEVAGQWVTYLPLSALGIWQVLAGFFLFRIFDVLKPFPVRQSENCLPGGFGVMLDDMLAGAYGAILLWLATMIAS